jgi:hypothetical protein
MAKSELARASELLAGNSVEVISTELCSEPQSSCQQRLLSLRFDLGKGGSISTSFSSSRDILRFCRLQSNPRKLSKASCPGSRCRLRSAGGDLRGLDERERRPNPYARCPQIGVSPICGCCPRASCVQTPNMWPRHDGDSILDSPANGPSETIETGTNATNEGAPVRWSLKYS